MKASTGRALFVLAILATGLSLDVAEAQELDLRWTVSIGSKHINTDADFNEFNPGLGFEARLAPERKTYAMGGLYYNSESTVSMYGGVGYEGVTVAPGVQLGVEAGLVTGYSGGFILPTVAGVVRFADHAKVLVLPPTPVSPLTFGLQVAF